MVYILKNHSNNTVKIGRTNNIEERLSTLQVGSSDRLEPLYILDTVDDTFETHMHEICTRYHLSGEWFEGRVLDDHLLRHPWYANPQNMKPYTQWAQEAAHGSTQR